MIGLRIITAVVMLRVARSCAAFGAFLADTSAGMLDEAERRMDGCPDPAATAEPALIVAVVVLAIAVVVDAAWGWL